MSKTLGEKIKEIRKELNMTQVELAGNEMTKSMVSQIENNQATPSMKNLQYIASRLNRPITYFIDDEYLHKDIPIDDIYASLKNITKLIEARKSAEARPLIEDILNKYNFDNTSKLYADILSKYGECLIDLNLLDEGEDKIKLAVDIYSNKYMYDEAAKIYLLLAGRPWNNFDYTKCSEIVDYAFNIYSKSISKNYVLEIEMLFYRSMFLFGVDKAEDTIAILKNTLDISKETCIYYKADNMYKNLAVIYMFMEKYEEFEYNIEKARQYAIFTENITTQAEIAVVCAIYYNKINQPNKAIEYTELSEKLSSSLYSIAALEKAKAHYSLGDYNTALDVIKQVKYPTHYVPFKYDYLYMWSSKVHEGLILYKLGHHDTALEAINFGIEKLEIFSESNALAFAYKSLSEIYSYTNDYEKAFAALKRANEIEKITKEKKMYY